MGVLHTAVDVSCSSGEHIVMQTCKLLAPPPPVHAEFIQLVSSEANEFATKENKNTIHPDHVMRALQELGFQDFLTDINQTWEHYKEDAKSRRGK